MALMTAYLQTTKNLQNIINSLISAKAPERFTNKFLEDLGFKSTNDRLYIGVFKGLGLLDENGVPTQRYHQFLDQSETGKVLAIGIQEAYEDLFALRKDAQTLSNDEVKGKLKTLTQDVYKRQETSCQCSSLGYGPPTGGRRGTRRKPAKLIFRPAFRRQPRTAAAGTCRTLPPPYGRVGGCRGCFRRRGFPGPAAQCGSRSRIL